jgi:hypothetical protein
LPVVTGLVAIVLPVLAHLVTLALPILTHLAPVPRRALVQPAVAGQAVLKSLAPVLERTVCWPLANAGALLPKPWQVPGSVTHSIGQAGADAGTGNGGRKR